jgi:Glycosyltransferase family 87
MATLLAICRRRLRRSLAIAVLALAAFMTVGAAAGPVIWTIQGIPETTHVQGATTQAHPGLQFDFKGDLYLAGKAILDGRNPYQGDVVAAEADVLRSGGELGWLASPRYPPPVLLAAVPFSFLPYALAAALFMLLCAASVLLALRLLGVRDWRCIAVAAVSGASTTGVLVGNLSPLLFLGVAVVWRWRSTVWACATAVAAVIVAKLILWPLAVWLLVTRRLRAFAAMIVIAVLGTLLSWAVIGFDGITSYPHMLKNVAHLGEMRGASLVTALLQVGVPRAAARAVAMACAGILLILAWRIGRRPGGDRRAFGLCIVAALTATPVVWMHYLVLLYVPVALLSPRFSPIWLVPIFANANPWIDLAVELIIVRALCFPEGLRAPAVFGSRVRGRSSVFQPSAQPARYQST